MLGEEPRLPNPVAPVAVNATRPLLLSHRTEPEYLGPAACATINDPMQSIPAPLGVGETGRLEKMGVPFVPELVAVIDTMPKSMYPDRVYAARLTVLVTVAV